GALRAMRNGALRAALGRLIGIPLGPTRSHQARDPTARKAHEQYETCVGQETVARLREVECGAGAQLANYSIYQEVSPQVVAASGWETVVYDGDLEDMPVFLVAPDSAAEVSILPEVQGAHAHEAQRMQRFFARTRERYLAASTNSRRIYAPTGTTHHFVYEDPDFVITTLRDILISCPKRVSPSTEDRAAHSELVPTK